jgi:ABC-2 type transport system permease protein
LIPPFLAYLLAAASIENPEGDLSIYGSYFPLTAPIMMMTRIPMGVDGWELLVAIGGIGIMSYLLLLASSRIFRLGILTRGKRFSWKDLWNGLRSRH